MTGLDVLAARLRELREGLWDPAAGLEAVPPGVAPGVDLAALGLHTVRESAYGALADLEDGRVDRAVVALRRIVALQLHAPGRPWDGTFPVTAEQPPPPEEGAVEWLHWDPNWRQFVGTALALVVERHGEAVGPTVVEELLVPAVRACVRGEPDDRIPPWYTNPDLLHAWLLGWLGAQDGSTTLLAAGEARARAAAERVRRHGDVDEYSSPTYDGVDLLAAGLWAVHPPSPAYVDAATVVLGAIGPRIAALFHPHLGAMCGPYIRAYGLGLDRYVALVSPWLVAAGAPVERVLPWPLDEATDHVHDLWAVPIVAALAPAVAPWLVVRTDLPRRHVQRFGSVEAVSVLTSTAALGAERGRRPEFARDQHVPVTLHHGSGWVGVAEGEGAAGIDATVEGEASIRAMVVPAEGAATVAIRTLWSAESVITDGGARLAVGAMVLTPSAAPASVTVEEEHPGWRATLTWPASASPVTVTLTVG
ncbi:hypothetical protein HC251_03725 [Iamia sp. SCSIO 61187]|uniref:hypothetical protein n=1 Tax=Iamia sp. SCSIO 61187 TaxID=2722752 RepID=UPI001C638137|nr:hypothetical protein [Iamia sp. SCSIO 61187]QYG91634.1 hypothetical protein HC251_03725 [Iamia sp. SCSIO 61187]